MSKEIEIAKLLNVKVNTDTGQVFLEMEVTDPVWKQKVLRRWQNVNVKIILEEKNPSVFSYYDEQAELTEEDFAKIKEQIGKWGPK